MNVSHAAAIIMYELFKNSKTPKIGDNIKYATKDDKQRIFSLVNETLNKLAFTSEQKKNTQRLVWKKLIGKSNLTKRELMTMYGFLRKIK
jgi:tRNA C32,U32 (ribose-2'-O)-methylase TrmJ